MKSPQKIRANMAKRKAEQSRERHEAQLNGLNRVTAQLEGLYELINGRKEFDGLELTEQVKQLNETLDLKKELQDLKDAVKLENHVNVDFAEVIKAIQDNKPEFAVDLTKLEKAIIEVQQRIDQGSVIEQAPEEFQPVRRVIKVGNRLVFDDRPTGTGHSGGGGTLRIRGNGNSSWGDDSLDNDAAVTHDKELITTQTERELNVWVDLIETSVGASKYAILIDLSDTTNFPHNNTGRVDISALRVSTDRGTFNGAIRVGVITRIDGTNADITYFKNTFIDSSLGSSFIEERNYSPSQIKCGFSGGVLQYGLSNSKETNVTSVNTGVTLNSPRGSTTVTPAVGDVIVKYDRSSGTLTNVAVFALYHGQAIT